MNGARFSACVDSDAPATDHDSEDEEFVQGLASRMRTLELNAEADDPGQIMLETAHEEKRQLFFRYRRQYGPGQKLWTGRCNVNKFDDSRPKELASISVDLRISGKAAVSVQT